MGQTPKWSRYKTFNLAALPVRVRVLLAVPINGIETLIVKYKSFKLAKKGQYLPVLPKYLASSMEENAALRRL